MLCRLLYIILSRGTMQNFIGKGQDGCYSISSCRSRAVSEECQQGEYSCGNLSRFALDVEEETSTPLKFDNYVSHLRVPERADGEQLSGWRRN